MYHGVESCVQGLQPSLEAGWPAMAADSGALGSHDFTCEVSRALTPHWVDFS